MDISNAVTHALVWLDQHPAVQGVAEGRYHAKPCITVFSTDKATATLLPKTFKGFRVVVDSGGEFLPASGP
jgi:hypothetical protein